VIQTAIDKGSKYWIKVGVTAFTLACLFLVCITLRGADFDSLADVLEVGLLLVGMFCLIFGIALTYSEKPKEEIAPPADATRPRR